VPPQPDVLCRKWSTRGDIPQLVYLLHKYKEEAGDDEVDDPDDISRKPFAGYGAKPVTFDIDSRNRHVRLPVQSASPTQIE
jgi:hypothetical protein